MMNFYQRAIRYVLRQKSKSLLLGSVLFITLIVSLSGVIILRVTNEMIDNLAKNSNAKVSLIADDLNFSNSVPLDEVNRLKELDNIRQVNKINRLEVTINDYIELGFPEPVFGFEVWLNGNDDLTLDGQFFTQTKRLIEGSLDLQGNEVVVPHTFAEMNDWVLGSVIPFANEAGEIVELVVAGTYRLSEETGRQDSFAMYTTAAVIDELQGHNSYSEVSFFVTNPAEINETKEEMESLIDNSDYLFNVSDALYRRMKSPLDSTRGIVNLMLMVTIVASTIIVSLLLSLWVRERRKETGLLLAVKETKLLIMGQRLLEIFMIFLVAFSLAVIILVVVIPHLGDMVFGMQDVQIYEGGLTQYPEFYLTFIDVIKSLGVGSITLLLSITISFISIIKSTPRSMLLTID